MQPSNETVINALLLTTLSGLSTALGGLIVLGMGTPSDRALGHMLSFSSGVMLFISFSDLLVDSIQEIGYFHANLWFFIGILFFATVAYFVPEPDTEKWVKHQKSQSASGKVLERDLLMAGIMTALGISLHNFPEGIAVYLTALRGLHVGLPLSFAIAVHNIPEGMAVAAPIYSVTKSKWLAFKWSLLSGIFEPLGAIVVGYFFTSYLTGYIIHCALAGVSGIMVYMCMKELTPQALKYLDSKAAMTSSCAGMFVIFISVHFMHEVMGKN